ncbi:Multi-sensor hybrid histidine kinase [Candidatus Sulfobium mesophilum]|uniref:histidine kinase n=1 Tax=Candidatus Sulfobium mesophilum TaxID=2016548 RepID=A0A2U3QE70_9BACT|nr:Multi-sensor hybrid histidine kinase [Candidatus Sulfobium mesophilum]
MEKIRILVVEDEAIIARDLQKRLHSQGYIVTSAVSTGEDAILKAKTDAPDLVLMDIVLLGEIDGIEAAGRIRALSDIPVVYVTAYADEKILERAKITEPYGYILKPFDDRELRSVIEMALYKSSTEKQMRKTNEFLSTVIESLSHPFYVVNADDYTVAMANSAANFAELNGKSTCHALTHHSDSPCSGNEHPCTMMEIRRTGKPVSQEHIHYDNFGRARTYEIRGYPIFDKAGHVVQIIEYTQDITDKKMLESQFRQSQKMESVGRLAGGVAHDFNNLLTAILGYSELALAALPEGHPLRRYIGTIAEAGNKAEALVRQLLAFSRKQILEIKTININDVIEDIKNIMQLVIGEDLILELNLSPSVKNVRADAGQIEQLLMNLAVNAKDAMPCGGRLTVETENVELGEEYARSHTGVTPGSYVMLAVTDTGTGMSREVQEKIFEPFFTTKGSRGTGLGLATVYGIVKQHNGSIYVYSEENVGTTFKVYLPSTGDVTEAREKEGKILDLRGAETVLVVDDEPSIRKIVIDTLEPLGYRVIEASFGEEALQRSSMTGDKIDMLLTDVIMPDINGPELAERIKETRPAIKVLFMSGYTAETIEHHGVAEMRKRFLQKPLTPKKLMEKIREVLDKGQ